MHVWVIVSPGYQFKSIYEELGKYLPSNADSVVKSSCIKIWAIWVISTIDGIIECRLNVIRSGEMPHIANI